MDRNNQSFTSLKATNPTSTRLQREFSIYPAYKLILDDAYGGDWVVNESLGMSVSKSIGGISRFLCCSC